MAIRPRPRLRNLTYAEDDWHALQASTAQPSVQVGSTAQRNMASQLDLVQGMQDTLTGAKHNMLKAAITSYELHTTDATHLISVVKELLTTSLERQLITSLKAILRVRPCAYCLHVVYACKHGALAHSQRLGVERGRGGVQPAAELS